MRLKLVLLATLTLLPLPALADITARYTVGKETLLVEVDDGGNARIGIEGKGAIIRRAGVDYLVVYAGPEAKVTQFAEMVSVIKAQMPKLPAPTGPADMTFTLTAAGETAVAGRNGTRWALGAVRKEAPAKQDNLIVVMTGDPQLAPVGALFRGTAEVGLGFLDAVIPPGSGLGEKLRELLAKGTPLSVSAEGDKPSPVPVAFTFVSADTAEIDAKRFELPAPVMTAGEFLMGMGSGGAMGAVPPLP